MPLEGILRRRLEMMIWSQEACRFEIDIRTSAENCWVTGSAMYQRTDIVADMIMDFHKVFIGADPSELKYMTKLE